MLRRPTRAHWSVATHGVVVAGTKVAHRDRSRRALLMSASGVIDWRQSSLKASAQNAEHTRSKAGERWQSFLSQRPSASAFVSGSARDVARSRAATDSPSSQTSPHAKPTMCLFIFVPECMHPSRPCGCTTKQFNRLTSVATARRSRPEFGLDAPTSGRSSRNRVQSSSPRFYPRRSKLGRHSTKLCRRHSCFSEISHIWPKPPQVGPKLHAKFGRVRSKLGRKHADFGRCT